MEQLREKFNGLSDYEKVTLMNEFCIDHFPAVRVYYCDSCETMDMEFKTNLKFNPCDNCDKVFCHKCDYSLCNCRRCKLLEKQNNKQKPGLCVMCSTNN